MFGIFLKAVFKNAFINLLNNIFTDTSIKQVYQKSKD